MHLALKDGITTIRGVDLYVHRDNADVYPFMPGEIVAYGSFTGAACGSPWWNDTYYIAIKHENIVIVYGEIILNGSLFALSSQGQLANRHSCVGRHVTINTNLGTVIPVTKNRHIEYPYHNSKMLHVEIYNADEFKASKVDEWELDKKQPTALINPTQFLLSLQKKEPVKMPHVPADEPIDLNKVIHKQNETILSLRDRIQNYKVLGLFFCFLHFCYSFCPEGKNHEYNPCNNRRNSRIQSL